MVLRALICLLLSCGMCLGQSVTFRATSIDLEQNSRLDQIEKTQAEIQSTLKMILERQAAVSPFKPEPVSQAATVEPPKQVESIPAPRAELVPEPVRTVSARLSQGELLAVVRANFPRGWTGPRYADVSPRSMVWQHLGHHGFDSVQISGLSQSDALALHDLAHGGIVSAVRSGVRAAASTTANVIRSSAAVVENRVIQPIQKTLTLPANSGCANGQCARQSQPTFVPRARLFRW